MQRHDSFSRLYYIMQIISPYGSQLCTIQGLYIICHNNRNVELSDTLIKVLHDLRKKQKNKKKNNTESPSLLILLLLQLLSSV